MSNTIGADPFNASAGLIGRLADNASRIRLRVDQLSEQSSTGLVAQTYGGLGNLARVSLDLRPQIARADIWQQNINLAGTKVDQTIAVLGQLQSIATSFASSLNGVGVQMASGVTTLASQASSALSQVQALLNTRFGQGYLLAGEDSSTAPVPDQAFNTYVQNIQTAASGLATGNATATITSTLSIANSQSPFSSTLGTTAAQVPVDDGVSVPIGVVAGQDATAQQTGASTTGSYVRDLIRSLATIATFNSGSVILGTDFTAIVADTRTSLQGTTTAIIQDVAGQGVIKDQLNTHQMSVTATQNVLTAQVSNVENVDAAATISALTQTQSQLAASYKLIAMVQSLSLAAYL